MTATLKTTVIQEPSSATANMTLDTSGGVTIGQNLTVAGSVSGVAGRLLRAPQILTSGTSYTTPAGCTSIYVEAIGAGGGGGGADSAVDARYQASGGGGSGAYVAKYFTVTPSTSYTYAIGTGGAGGANTGASGSTGGSTTFTVGGTTITATGGTGGQGYQSNGSNSGRPARGGGGGTATNGDLNVDGNAGSMGFVNTDGIQYYATGSGGGSFFGGGAQGLNTTGAGTAGTSGGGGSGAASSLATGNAGGAGGNGLIRIWEYA